MKTIATALMFLSAIATTAQQTQAKKAPAPEKKKSLQIIYLQ